MTVNRWRGDAAEKQKVILFPAPADTSSRVLVSFSVGNKSLSWSGWNATTMVTDINAAQFPELADVTVARSGSSIEFTGILNDDFDVSIEIVPTALVEFTQATPKQNQISRLTFNGATSGTFTLTLDGETTSAITLFADGAYNIAGITSAIDALTSFSTSDVTVTDEGTAVEIEFAGSYESTPVAVSIDASELDNSGTFTARQVESYRPAMHDIWTMWTGQDFVFDLSDGTGTVNIKSNETDAEVAEKLTEGFGYEVEVMSERQTNSEGSIVDSRFWLLNFVGNPGADVTLTVSNIEPSDEAANPEHDVHVSRMNTGTASIGTQSTETNPPEFILVDARNLSDSFGDWVFDGEDLEVSDASLPGSYRDALIDLYQFQEWSVFYPTCNYEVSSVFYNRAASKMFVLSYISDAARRNGASGLDETDYGGEDFDASRLTSENVEFKVIREGGSTIAARSVVQHLSWSAGAATLAGTYTLEFAEGVTGDIDITDDAADLQTELRSTTGDTGLTVSGSGTVGDPFVVTYSNTADRALPTLASSSLTGDGSAALTVSQSAVFGVNAEATVTVAPFADGGTYSLKFGNEGPRAFSPGINAAAFKAILESFPSLSTSGDTAVEYNSASGVYTIDFRGNFAKQEVDELYDVDQSLTSSTLGTITKKISQFASGSKNFNDPLNWTLSRVPHSGDDLVIDSGSDITYGLRLFNESEIRTSSDEIYVPDGFDFVDNQIVRFIFGETAPSDLSESTDYYVINANHSVNTFQISTSANGTPIDLTDAGTGPHYCGVIVSNLAILSDFTAALGLERANSDGFDEYRNRFLRLGVATGNEIEVGRGDGTGSGLLRIGFGNSTGQITVHNTSSTQVVGKPALIIDADTDDGTLLVRSGDVGLALYQDETAKIGSFNVLSGTLSLGNVTVVENAIATSGTLKSDRTSIEGLLKIV